MPSIFPAPGKTNPLSSLIVRPCPDNLLESELFGFEKGALYRCQDSEKGPF